MSLAYAWLEQIGAGTGPSTIIRLGPRPVRYLPFAGNHIHTGLGRLAAHPLHCRKEDRPVLPVGEAAQPLGPHRRYQRDGTCPNGVQLGRRVLRSLSISERLRLSRPSPPTNTTNRARCSTGSRRVNRAPVRHLPPRGHAGALPRPPPPPAPDGQGLPAPAP